MSDQGTHETRASTAGYAEAAGQLVDQYESVAFADVHHDVLHLFPARAGTVLDIGAGSGRDAAALAALGHRVVAVEPTAELRARGRAIHAGAGVEWVDDALPDLPVLRGLGHGDGQGHRADDTDTGTGTGTVRRTDTDLSSYRRFDLILLTAVWMHLDAAERTAAMGALAGLLADEGRIVLSLRHGPVPPGRRMFDVTADETVRLARTHGLHPVHRSERADPHGRPGVRWSHLGLRGEPAGI
ncbi:class I SAM-dependent methyltransferase [Actinacidiphila yanglinensis]|uniref:class I SAM-dependent methyltransferase n=1 Tax=Actinacidiphila yanglinensis TaxID=310779 RepID=UPI000CDF1960|nr:class I SAM-dependent methyltransferase [Actinacidiphila yanglinensis]